MEIDFTKPLLWELYQGKKITDKAFKSNPQLVHQYIKTVNKLKAAKSLEMLYTIKSLNFKALSGDLAGLNSVRINDQFRLIFKIVFNQNSSTEVQVLELQEISNHYAR